MAFKVVIDAGHGGADPGAVYQGRQEKDDNLNLALLVGQLLEAQGVDVEYTRTSDIYQTPFEKAEIGNNTDADFFISFHRNSSPWPNQYSGVETLVYDKSGAKLDLAENINGALGELGYQDLGVQARPGLVVLRKTKMPAVLIETGFINNDQDNQLFDTQFQQAAQLIADAILGTLNEQIDEQETLYRVQVGQFRVKQNADALLYELLDRGYPAFVIQEDGFYKVQVGAYKMLGNAIKMEQQLRRAGYDTWITT